MITFATAIKLKQAGLDWQPALFDHFAIPDRGFNDRIFVISDIQATIEWLQGRQVIAFQGASEWALDDISTEEIIWLPKEEQLRQALEAALLPTGEHEVNLLSNLNGARCTIRYKGVKMTFKANDASEAYAAALIHLLQNSESDLKLLQHE